MGRLTTHVLDTARGMPAGNLSIDLYKLVDNSEQKIKSVLNDFIGLTDGDNLYFEIGDEKVFAKFEEGREEEDKISSVHYVQFHFSEDQICVTLRTYGH